jgi:hypothetical protein
VERQNVWSDPLKRNERTSQTLLIDEAANDVDAAELWSMHDHYRGCETDVGFPESVRSARCQPTVVSRRSSETAGWRAFEFAGACLGCGWMSEPFEEYENAVYAAHDHSHPQWKTLPRVRPVNSGSGADLARDHGEWKRRVGRFYPDGWFDGGGPVVTQRTGRPVPTAVPGGGYEIPCGAVATKRVKARKVMLVAPPSGKQWNDYDKVVYDPETGGVTSLWKMRSSAVPADTSTEYDDEFDDDWQ